MEKRCTRRTSGTDVSTEEALLLGACTFAKKASMVLQEKDLLPKAKALLVVVGVAFSILLKTNLSKYYTTTFNR